MNRKLVGMLLLVSVAFPWIAVSAQAAPDPGFIYCATSDTNGNRVPFVPISIQKLAGNYPVPEGPYITDAFGRIWIALYPGVYRLSIREPGFQPCYWIVPVSSHQKIPVFFLIPPGGPRGSGTSPDAPPATPPCGQQDELFPHRVVLDFGGPAMFPEDPVRDLFRIRIRREWV